MSRYYQRPENALKRANEFIEVGKPARALDTLAEVIKSKKYRSHSYSDKVLEPIMFKYLELCVDLKKSHMAKEGLFQYRNLCQTVNVASLESVVRGYLTLAEEKTEAARQESHQAVVDIDDLDNIATPESILLSAVSGEDAQDRSDRIILTPWVKFLWESYRQCLELLRTNSRVEKLYHDTAQQAFKFCLKYSRKTEFRKLCDNIRTHLAHAVKQANTGQNSINLSNPDTQQMNLETRLLQLDSAIQMELWQEAYKAIEDINGLMTLSKKMPRPQMMANYYQKLALVFWKAGNHLFHAAALFRLFQLSRDQKKNITVEELQKLGSRVLVATLAVPLPSAHPEFDRFIETEKSAVEKTQRLATLLALPQPPTRAGLIKDLVRLNVVGNVVPQLQDLYRFLEVEFDPLHVCTKMQTCLDYVQNAEEVTHLRQYVPALQDITLTRLVKQVAQVYQSIEFKRLLELAPFTTAFDMEQIIVNAARHNDMQIRIDHRRGCLHFGTDLSESQREDLPEGPTLQAMPSEQVRTQLKAMYSVLHKAIRAVQGPKLKAERVELREQIVATYLHTKDREHQRLLMRQKIIEDRKEYMEKINTEREEEEARRQEEVARLQYLAEQRRLESERMERERLRQEEEIRQIQARHLKEKVAQISLTAIGLKVMKKLEEEDIAKLDPEMIVARQVEELEKERRELQARLKSQDKKIDHLERAKRIEEIPLLEKFLEERQVRDAELWDIQEKERIAEAIEERHLAVATRDRLVRMQEDRDKFVDQVRSARMNEYQEKLETFEKNLNEERSKRLVERKEQRREQRRTKWIQEREEEEQRKRDEEFKRAREEKEREESERRAAEEEEYMKRKAVADAVAEKQKQREREVEEKLRRKEEEARDSERSLRDREREPSRAAAPAKDSPGDWRRSAAPTRDAREEEPAAKPEIYKPTGRWRESAREAKFSAGAPPREERDRERDRDRDEGPRDWRSERAAAAPDRDRERPVRDFGSLRDRGERTERVERGERSERGDRGDRERVDREGGRPERGDRSERFEDRGERRVGGAVREERERPSESSSWRTKAAPQTDDRDKEKSRWDRDRDTRRERDEEKPRGDRGEFRRADVGRRSDKDDSYRGGKDGERDRPPRDREGLPRDNPIRVERERDSRDAGPATAEKKQRREEVDDEGFATVGRRK